jgi:DNA-binding NarL/FixJ family response regulator
MIEPQVLIVDDHEIVRYGLKVMIQEHFPGCRITEADSYETMEAALGRGKFTHMILDLQLKDVNLLELLPHIREEHPGVSILIHTMADDVEDAVWSKGADEYLNKGSSQDETIAVLARFLQADEISPVAARHPHGLVTPHGRMPENDPFMRLSTRERDLVRLMLNGNTYKNIQNILHLKSSTVSTMKRRIFRKLGISNLVELVKMAESHKFRPDTAPRLPRSRY